MEKSEIIFRSKEILQKIAKSIFFLLALILGYSVCEIYHYTKQKKSTPKEVRKISETSVALNERGELMIIDRKTGDYTIYQDSVGKSIFTIYATGIQSKYESVK
jgi:hypothetical protein